MIKMPGKYRRTTILGLLLILLVGAGCKPEKAKLQGESILLYSSPDSETQLEIRGDATFIFAPQQLYLYLHHKGETQKLRDYVLHNDGAGIAEHNFDVNWQEGSRLQMVCHGQEQQDDTLVFDY